PCIGLCDQAPAALLTEAVTQPKEQLSGAVTASEATTAVRTGTLPDRPRPKVPQQGDKALRLLARVGVVDPTDIKAYERSGGFRALARARELGAKAVIQEVTRSGLLGRGGAAFPAGRKWDAVAAQPETPRYVICNAD